MQTTQTSNQVFNVGDYVKTSKGKIGVICENQYWYLKDKLSFEPELSQTGKKFNSFEEAEEYYNQYLFVDIQLSVPKVKLGNKEYLINSDKLQKLEKLKIRTQQGFSQHEVELPIADAKLLMDIYIRNKIWFAIV